MNQPRTITTKTRGCGRREPRAVYLVSEGSPFGSLPLWTTLHPPVPIEDKFHRGPVLVDGDAILARLPEDKWLVGSSAERRRKQDAQEWALERFGMTTYTRLSTGECDGLEGADKAMEHLLRTVQWHPRLVDYVRTLTVEEVHEIPRAQPHFNDLARSLQDFAKTQNARSLVYAAAAVWRIADSIPPSKLRGEIVATLVSILYVLGLKKDAVALRDKLVVLQ